MLSQTSTSTSSRSPQGPVTAPSPQYIDNNTITPHTGSESPYKTPTTPVRSPHVQPSEFSPFISNLQTYSPTLTSPTIASSYVPPPSPTPSQKGEYPVPGGYYSNAAATYPAVADGKSSQQYNMYRQDPYQQTYQDQLHQQVYPDPVVVHAYPDPALVDIPMKTEKPKPSTILITPTKLKSTGRRKKIIWAMVIITLILIGVIVYLVVSMKKDKDSSNPSSPGGRVQAPPIPPYPSEKGHCPSFFCHNYFFTTCKGECKTDSVYKQCKSECKGEFFCEMRCEDGEKCFDDCRTNLWACDDYC